MRVFGYVFVIKQQFKILLNITRHLANPFELVQMHGVTLLQVQLFSHWQHRIRQSGSSGV